MPGAACLGWRAASAIPHCYPRAGGLRTPSQPHSHPVPSLWGLRGYSGWPLILRGLRSHSPPLSPDVWAPVHVCACVNAELWIGPLPEPQACPCGWSPQPAHPEESPRCSSALRAPGPDHPPLPRLVQLGLQLPHFNLQPRAFTGRLVQHPPGVSQLRLVQGLDATHLGRQGGAGAVGTQACPLSTLCLKHNKGSWAVSGGTRPCARLNLARMTRAGHRKA